MIDRLRAIAAVAVCLFHFGTSLELEKHYPSAVCHVIESGHLGVSAFFVISGFVIPLSMKNWKLSPRRYGLFLIRRLVRLYPAYLVAMLLSLVLWKLSTYAPGFRGSGFHLEATGLLTSLTMTAGVFDRPWVLVVAWTLAIEIQFYLVIGLLLPIFQHSSRLIQTSGLLAFVLLPLLLQNPAYLTLYATLFGAGLATFLVQTRRLGWPEYLIVLATSVGVEVQIGRLDSAFICLLSAAVLFLKVPASRFWTWLGAISYSLYLLHCPIGGRIVNLGNRIPDFTGKESLIITVALLVSLLAADLFYRWVESWGLNLSKRLGQKSRQTTIVPEVDVALPAMPIAEPVAPAPFRVG